MSFPVSLSGFFSPFLPDQLAKSKLRHCLASISAHGSLPSKTARSILQLSFGGRHSLTTLISEVLLSRRTHHASEVQSSDSILPASAA